MLNENLVKFCQKLIQAESISGNEGKVASLIKEEMTKLNYDEIVVDEYGNVIGKITGNGNKSLMYDGHMDTVAIPDPSKWTVDPFGAEIIDGKMYGRGTSDMKCALATMIYAAARLKEEKVDLKGDVYIAAVVFEEIFEGMGLGKILDKITPSAVVIGEASRLTLNVGQRGRAEIVVETEGVNAHSSSPEKGVNAVYSMMKLIPEIRNIEVATHEKLGKGIFELTDLKSSPYPGASVVPDKCRSTYDRRLLVGEKQEDVLKPVLDVIEILKKTDSTFSATAKIVSAEEETYQGVMLGGERFFPAWLIDEDSEIVKSAVEGMKNANMEAKIQCYSFCTDGSESAGKRGIPTIGIGPSLETLAHVVDEYIELSEIEKAEEIYFEISKAFLK